MIEKYTKQKLMASREFSPWRDILAAILDDGKMYTIKETKKALNEYLRRKVN